VEILNYGKKQVVHDSPMLV